MASHPKSSDLDPADIAAAVRVLVRAGAVFSFSLPMSRSLTIDEAGQVLGFSPSWVRAHLGEFPGRWRAPGGGNGGEWRIPRADIEAFMRSRRVNEG